MGFFWWILSGALAGALAKAVMPGTDKEPSGWMMTIVLGICGGLLGGFIANLLGVRMGGFFGSSVVAFGGACLIIWIMRQVSQAQKH